MITKFLLPLLVFAVAPLCAQTIYKCKDAAGNPVFSQQPCANNVNPLCIQTDDKVHAGACQRKRSGPYDGLVNSDDKAKADPAPTVHQPPQTAPISASPKAKKMTAVEAISDEVADNDCRSHAQEQYMAPSTDSIDRAQKEIDMLNGRVWEYDFHGQELDQMDRQRVATLRQTIAMETARNDAVRAASDKTYADAIRRCNDEKEKREQ